MAAAASTAASAVDQPDSWTSDEEKEEDGEAGVGCGRAGQRKALPMRAVHVEGEPVTQKRVRRPDAVSWSEDEEDVPSVPCSQTSSSPPSFMSKEILRQSREKQAREVASAMTRLQDIAAPAPARTRQEKAKLTKYFCADCESYYATFPNRDAGSSSCRHRRVEARPVTPPHYWQLDIPSSPAPPSQPSTPSPQEQERESAGDQ